MNLYQNLNTILLFFKEQHLNLYKLQQWRRVLLSSVVSNKHTHSLGSATLHFATPFVICISQIHINFPQFHPRSDFNWIFISKIKKPTVSFLAQSAGFNLALLVSRVLYIPSGTHRVNFDHKRNNPKIFEVSSYGFCAVKIHYFFRGVIQLYFWIGWIA